MFAFGPPRRPRRPSLTPMIDVVFLLLVFFMLAARFGQEGGIALDTGGQGAAWSGPPRLVEIGAETLRLNGVALARPALLARLEGLTETASDPVVLRPAPEVSLQRLVDVMEALRSAGHTRLLMVE
ncbi:biopolymer transporter ExbD [Maritimibacter sp. 55A14]|nr:biopolymer transporter ExbD [Maritimibacter sp. 55A14]